MSRTTYLALAFATRAVTDIPLLGMFFLIHFGWRGDGSPGNAVLNGAVFLAWAILHSLLARPPGRRTLSRFVGPDLVRVGYVIVAGVTLSAVLLAWRPVSGELWHTTGASAWVLSALYLASIVALVLVTLRFDYLEFLGLRQLGDVVAGRSRHAASLSVAGAYGYCRHPMYLAMLAAFWIGPVMSFGRLEFVLLSTVYLFVGLRFEEGNLRQELGPAYDQYRANVPMLIPRLTPWRVPTAETAEAQAGSEAGRRE
jgi:protein-S-isoprenylcysteine O-methyltransferase Ste14